MHLRDWWSVQQVAAELQVDAETVRRWIRRGILPAESLGRGTGGGYRVALADLDTFTRKRFGRRLGERPDQGQQEAA